MKYMAHTNSCAVATFGIIIVCVCVTLEAKLTTKICQFYVKNLSRTQTRIIETHRRVCACKHTDWFLV